MYFMEGLVTFVIMSSIGIHEMFGMFRCMRRKEKLRSEVGDKQKDPVMLLNKMDLSVLRQKFRGSVLGALSGDCLGAAYQGEPPMTPGNTVILQKRFDTLEGPEFKGKVRPSAANRRKLRRRRRQQQRSGALETLVETASETEVGGTGGAQRAEKRFHLEHNPSSPHNRLKEKKHKRGDQGTYAQNKLNQTQSNSNVNSVKLAVIPQSYPNQKLDAGGVTEVKKLLKEAILALPDGVKAPTFDGVWERDGAVVVNCTDKPTENWLKTLFPENKISGHAVHVVSLSELTKKHSIVVYVEDPEITSQEALCFLEKQNKGLMASKWVVVRGSETKDAKNSNFVALIDHSALAGLKACNFRPHCGLQKATVRELGQDRSGEKKAGTVGVPE
ncbi:uncharacterized protein LOC107048951 isoform X3 [Diachasma alloeum]|uniref:uncharacterized protein LOC107048951 isoform X3 n=1 Tax=Diachasma alloeum TaxID=454923 RepID=UPI00073844B3|nr:uncharacterized protein LOC107048951 isoform X3 [Diachasma alloeum]